MIIKTVNSQKTRRNQATSCLQKESPDRNFSPFPPDYAVSQRGSRVRWAGLPRATDSFAINYRIISWRTQTCCILRKNNTCLGSMFCFPVRISNPHDGPDALHRLSRVPSALFIEMAHRLSRVLSALFIEMALMIENIPASHGPSARSASPFIT